MKKLLGIGSFLLGTCALYLTEKAESNSSSYVNRADRERMIQDKFDIKYSEAWESLNHHMHRYEKSEWVTYIIPAILFTICLIFRVDQTIYFPVILVWVVIGIFYQGYAAMKINRFQCPRCLKPFTHIESGARSALSHLKPSTLNDVKCRSCKLPLWARNAKDEQKRSLKEHLKFLGKQKQ